MYVTDSPYHDDDDDDYYYYRVLFKMFTAFDAKMLKLVFSSMLKINC